jgi:fructose-bisphosphate aldolase, class II
MIVTSNTLYEKAKKGGYAVGAFNVSTPEAIRGILAAATELNAPVVIETSEGEMNYMGAKVVADIVRDLAEKLPIPVAIHLDHGQSLETVKAVIDAGYTSVHIDASALSYDENLALTKSVVEYAHDNGITVEGELGHVGGASEVHDESAEIEKSTYTDPEKAVEFVRETGIDVLASSIGNIHGIYENEPVLDFDRLESLGSIGISLSLHGGSGIPEEQVKRAIGLGINKINVNTELRAAYTDTLRSELTEKPDEIVPYKYLPEEIEAIKEVVKKKIIMFGSADKA